MRRFLSAGAVAVLLAGGALGVWLGLRSRGTTSSPTLGPTTAAPRRPAAPIGPVRLDAAGLEARAGGLGQDVYWLGAAPRRRYELERTSAGEVFVRYVGAGSGPETTVGTYPLENAYAATRAFAAGHGWTREHVEAWLVVTPAAGGTAVYLAAQGFPYQVEVYDPTPGRARSLVESGAVTPVR